MCGNAGTINWRKLQSTTGRFSTNEIIQKLEKYVGPVPTYYAVILLTYSTSTYFELQLIVHFYTASAASGVRQTCVDTEDEDVSTDGPRTCKHSADAIFDVYAYAPW